MISEETGKNDEPIAGGLPLNRRHFLARSAKATLAGLAGVQAWPAASAEAEAVNPSFADPLNAAIQEFMSARKVPGGAVAVVKDQRLVFARGYGWADREKQEAMPASALFRIASISKPITAVAILKLVEAGRLELDRPVVEFLPFQAIVPQGKKADERMRKVTIRHCLHHCGGWDRDQSGDPMFRSRRIARAAGTAPPAMQETIICYMLGQPLDFAPGTRYAYSNFGFCLLGRVIERVTGMKYSAFVQQELLKPMGIRRMRLGASLAKLRADGEVKYYTPENRVGGSVFAGVEEMVPAPYGTFCLEAMDSHGGWLASAIDLVRFAAVLNSPSAGCLKPQTRATLFEAPPSPIARTTEGALADRYYGCGWDVRRVRTGKMNTWHLGSLPGTFTILVSRWDGFIWAALFNQRSEDSKMPDSAVDAALHAGINAVKQWPDHDLFSSKL